MWIYKVSTGVLTDPEGKWAGAGYSGNGADLNNPAAENVIGHGPIPVGMWEIGAFTTHPKLGELSAPLTPAADNDMDGREGGFFIHGDNAEMDHTASDGCIILGRPYRFGMAISYDRFLKVIP